MYGDSIDEDNQRVRHRSDANGAPSSSGEPLLPPPAMSPDWSTARPDPWLIAASIASNRLDLAPNAPSRAEFLCTRSSTAPAIMAQWLFAHISRGRYLQVCGKVY